MQLRIKKDQRDIKGVLGGQKAVEFSLHARVVLEPDESALCKKYVPQNEVLGTWVRPSDQAKTDITIAMMLNGHLFTGTRLFDILSLEEAVTDAAGGLHIYLDTAQSFGGETCIEIPPKV